MYTESALVKKHGGTRRICVPPLDLRILQDKLLRVFTLVYNPRPCVTGFAKGRNIIDNASPHAHKRLVLNFDLEDFFPTIHFGRVQGMLESGPFSLAHEAAMMLTQLVTHDDGHLPQGAPTSPIVANMVCGPLDTAMMAFAREHRFRYSRYADDITLSTTQRKLPAAVASVDDDGVCDLGAPLVDLIAKHHFRIRAGKTRARTSLRRQMATGLVINEFPNVRRVFLRDLRAMIHSCRLKGMAEAAKLHAEKTKRTPGGNLDQWIQTVIRGRLAFVKMVRGESDPIYRRLLRDANQIPGCAFWAETPPKDQPGQPLRRRSRLNVDWRLWADRYRHCVFRVDCTDPTGTSHGFGTAFRVGPRTFVTAGHNVDSEPTPAVASVRRVLRLEYPLGAPAAVSRVQALGGHAGGPDIALGFATLPAEWPAIFIPTQERLPQVGEEVAALGYPDIARRHLELVLHVGRAEAVTTDYHGCRFITVSFASGPALSGSPLLDANGHCVGVMVENTYLGTSGPTSLIVAPDPLQGAARAVAPAPARPYGQATAIGQWRDLPGCGHRLSTALDNAS